MAFRDWAVRDLVGLNGPGALPGTAPFSVAILSLAPVDCCGFIGEKRRAHPIGTNSVLSPLIDCPGAGKRVPTDVQEYAVGRTSGRYSPKHPL